MTNLETTYSLVKDMYSPIYSIHGSYSLDLESSSKTHEAGYDAVLTGIVFGRFAQKLGILDLVVEKSFDPKKESLGYITKGEKGKSDEIELSDDESDTSQPVISNGLKGAKRFDISVNAEDLAPSKHLRSNPRTSVIPHSIYKLVSNKLPLGGVKVPFDFASVSPVDEYMGSNVDDS